MKGKLTEFIKYINDNPLELYSEFGLQHELAIFFRNNFENLKVYLEYPVSRIFGASSKNIFLKKEIDLFIIDENNDRFIIELKMPKFDSGTPNEMYRVFEDFKFLEQLKENNIKGCYSILFTNDTAFYNAKRPTSNIYNRFNGAEINIFTLNISDLPPFLHKKGGVVLSKKYKTNWQVYNDIDNNEWKFFIIEF